MCTWGRLASTANTTPLTGHWVSFPAFAPGCASTSFALCSSLVAQAKRQAPDITVSKLPVRVPCGFSHAALAAPVAGGHQAGALFPGRPGRTHPPPPAGTPGAPPATSASPPEPALPPFLARLLPLPPP